MDQKQYLQKILCKFGSRKSTQKYQRILMDYCDFLWPTKGSDPRVDPKKYGNISGSVIFTMIYTRPNITFKLGRLIQFMKDPAEFRKAAIKKLFCYIRLIISHKLKFGPGRESYTAMYSEPGLTSDRNDRKSMTGSVSILCGRAIFWLSWNQKDMATATAGAKYIAIATTAKQGQ